MLNRFLLLLDFFCCALQCSRLLSNSDERHHAPSFAAVVWFLVLCASVQTFRLISDAVAWFSCTASSDSISCNKMKTENHQVCEGGYILSTHFVCALAYLFVLRSQDCSKIWPVKGNSFPDA